MLSLEKDSIPLIYVTCAAFIDNMAARQWYIEECINNHWSARALDRQIGKLYYERLLASPDRSDVVKEALENLITLSPNPFRIPIRLNSQKNFVLAEIFQLNLLSKIHVTSSQSQQYVNSKHSAGMWKSTMVFLFAAPDTFLVAKKSVG